MQTLLPRAGLLVTQVPLFTGFSKFSCLVDLAESQEETAQTGISEECFMKGG